MQHSGYLLCPSDALNIYLFDSNRKSTLLQSLYMYKHDSDTVNKTIYALIEVSEGKTNVILIISQIITIQINVKISSILVLTCHCILQLTSALTAENIHCNFLTTYAFALFKCLLST